MRIIVLFACLLLPLYAFWFTSSSPKKVELQAPILDTTYEETMAHSYLNTLRKKAGISAFHNNNNLNQAARNHAKYLVTNHEIGHLETPQKPYYTGRTPKTRVLKTAYNTGLITENISVNAQNYKDAIDGLFSAIYHRFGFLNFRNDEIGIGVYQNTEDTNLNAFVFDMGIYTLNNLCKKKSYSGSKRYVYKVCKESRFRIEKSLFQKALTFQKSISKQIIIYPYHNQTKIPTAFYKETPDPMPDYEVSGFPVSIQFNDYFFNDVQLNSFKLYDHYGKPVKGKILTPKNDPNQRFEKGQFAFFPYHRLAYGEKYTAVVNYDANGQTSIKRWSFYTKALKKPFFVIKNVPTTIHIKPHTRYQIYFVPKDPHDLLENLHFPANVYVNFLDQNTISLELLSDNSDTFTLKGEKPLLKITVDR